MSDYWDNETCPKPDSHGTSPYPVDSTGDEHPGPSPGSIVADGANPYPIDSTGDVHPQADRHDGDMPLNLGKTKAHL